MHTLPSCKFRIGQRVRCNDEGDETGAIIAVLYAEEAPGQYWTRPGFTYFIRFDSPRIFEDDAHESELVEVDGNES